MIDAVNPSELEPMQRFRRRMEALRRRVMVTVVIVVVVGVYGAFQVPAMAARRDAAVVAVIAQQLAVGGGAPGEAVVVKVPAEVTYAPYRWLDQTPLGVWTVRDEEVGRADEAALQAARRTGDQWMVAYAIRETVAGWPNRMAVDVAVFYPVGVRPDGGRGGYASHWQLRRDAGGWQVVEEVIYLYWD